MKPGVGTEGVDHQDHAQDAVIEAQHGTEKQLKARFGAMAPWRQKFPVLLEIDA